MGECGLEVVDLVTWNKDRIGMGYRTRRVGEYLLILQKPPTRAEGVWNRDDIPDAWTEKVERISNVHPKPVNLQARLIKAVTASGVVVLDPAAGSYSVMTAAHQVGRQFLGCDIASALRSGRREGSRSTAGDHVRTARPATTRVGHSGCRPPWPRRVT